MARKTLYFDSYCGYLISAVTEDGKITEFNYEKRDRGSIIGNIYKGRVESVLKGMQAAFVNCGLERNCYLPADDTFADSGKYEASRPADAPAPPALKEGDEILVQVVKAPVGNKGAKVTAHPAFVGKAIIYLPDTPFIGVSRKIADDELRRNLAYCAQQIADDGEGLVVRTAAPYARRRQIELEYDYLKNIYGGIRRAFTTARTGDLLYTDFSLPVRVLRDTLSADIECIVTGNRYLKDIIEKMAAMYPPQNRRTVVLHDSGRDMLEEYGISAQILALASPRVELENGAYLVIEKCEALTVIDVNTGKFIGDESLEQTVYATNLCAAREIARQLRLRNIGGIVVVDFIDMQDEAHRRALTDELERALKKDHAKCAVSPMSRFGLVELTRKRTGSYLLSKMTKPCRHCQGAGLTLNEDFVILGLRAKLLDAVCGGASAIRLDVNADVLTRMQDWREFLSDLGARAKGVKIYAVPHRTYRADQVNLRADTFDIPRDAVLLNG